MDELEIACIGDIHFKISYGIYYSFFDSPYAPHRNGAAIDIYFEEDALFPLEEGVVREIKKINTPHNVKDFLVLIETEGLILKVLHVKPSIRKGDKLFHGDTFGKVIHSGFLSPWSDRHAHFELRKPSDPYRARGGLILKPIIQPLVPIVIGNQFIVVEKQERYVWIKPLKYRDKGLTPIVFDNKSIEGGIPHYSYGAIFGDIGEIELIDIKIRSSDRLSNNIRLFDTKNLIVEANGEEITGIGIYCNQSLLKLISENFEEDDIIEINIYQKLM